MRARIKSSLAIACLLFFGSACLTHNDFLNEMITPGETWTTSQFLGDFDEDYRINQFEITKTFASYAARNDVDPVAVIIMRVGYGGYQVTTIFREGGSVRANSLVMGHTKLACKYSRLFPNEREARNLTSFLDSSPLLQDYENTAEQTAVEQLESAYRAARFHDGILYISYTSGAMRIRHGFRPHHALPPDYRELYDRIEAFGASLVRTYPES